jgi:hypothetical protein
MALERVAEIASASPISAVSLSEDGQFLGIDEGATMRVWNLETSKSVATIPNLESAELLGIPCVAAGLRRKSDGVELSVSQCGNGQPVASWPLASRPQSLFDQQHVAHLCGVLVARDLNGFAAVDWSKGVLRPDLFTAFPVHFGHLAAPKTQASCTMYALRGGERLPQATNIVAIDVTATKPQQTYELAARADAEAPLLSTFANSAASPSGKFLAIASYRRDIGPGAATWGFYRVEILNTTTGELEPELRLARMGETVSSLVFIDDDRLLVATQGRETLLYNLRTRVSAPIDFDGLYVSFVDYSPAARRLAVASANQARVYRLLDVKHR